MDGVVGSWLLFGNYAGETHFMVFLILGGRCI
jgi:hypothetical protein